MNYKRSKHWSVHYPGEVYANDLRFNAALNEIEVRKYLRDLHKTTRLSNGLEVWPHND